MFKKLVSTFLVAALAFTVFASSADAGKARTAKDAGKNTRVNPDKEAKAKAPAKNVQAPAPAKAEAKPAKASKSSKAEEAKLANAQARRFVVDVPKGVFAAAKATNRLVKRGTIGFQQWPTANGYFTFLRAGRYTMSPGGEDVTYTTLNQKKVGTFLLARSTRAEEGLGIEGAATQQPAVYYFEIGNPKGIRRLQPVFDPNYPVGYTYTGYSDHGVYLVAISAVQVGRSALERKAIEIENAALEASADIVEDTTPEEDEEDAFDEFERQMWLYEEEAAEGVNLSYRIRNIGLYAMVS